MLSSLLLITLSASPSVHLTSCTDPTPVFAAVLEDAKQEYKRRRKEAGTDVDMLMELFDWCDANGLRAQGKSCLRRVIKLESGHKRAHKLLGHIEYKGQWFDNERKLEAFRKEHEAKEMEAKGLALFEGEWVPSEDIPFLMRGLAKNDDGEWVDPEEVEKLAQGWVRQDLVWVSPEEKGRIAEGLWKCDEDWKSIEEANVFHSTLENMWVISTKHFLLYTTCNREVADKAIAQIDQTYDDLVRALGVKPEYKIPVVVLRDQAQYGVFAAGSEELQRQATESHALSSVHYSFLADVWLRGDQHIPAGVSYWWAEDPSGYGDTWGKHAVRHAAGQSFVEAIDGSPQAVMSFGQGEVQSLEEFTEIYWDEKKLPDWYRFGAATYVERYFIDQFVGNGGNARWAWEWSVQNVAGRGGLHKLERLFEFGISVDNIEESQRLINESGLVMSFILDGAVQSVTDAHQALKATLLEGKEKEVAKAVAKLEKVLQKHEKDLRKFAKI